MDLQLCVLGAFLMHKKSSSIEPGRIPPCELVMDFHIIAGPRKTQMLTISKAEQDASTIRISSNYCSCWVGFAVGLVSNNRIFIS